MARRSKNFDHIKTCMVRGRRYALKWRRLPNNKKGTITHGACDPPDSKNREIFIYPQTDDPQFLLGTVLHECLHASFWDASEELVAEYEQSVMRLLRRMGVQINFTGKPKRRPCAKAKD